MKNILIVITILFCLSAHAQDIYYFDDNWDRVFKLGHTYSRTVEHAGRQSYFVTERYDNGAVYMKGSFNTTEPKYLKDARGSIFRDGFFTYYYKNGQVKAEGAYKKGVKTGIWTNYYNDGTIQSITKYNGNNNGLWWFLQTFDSLGNKETIQEYTSKSTQVIKEYASDGTLVSKMVYTSDKLTDSIVYIKEEANNDIIIKAAPKYNIYKYLNRHIFYNKEMEGIESRVVVSFTINEKGHPIDVYALSPKEPDDFRITAIDAIQNMRKWKPAFKNGEPVKMYFTLPIKFKPE